MAVSINPQAGASFANAFLSAGSGMSHLKTALVGDSITARVLMASGTPPANSVSAIGGWNWVNWLLGAPFVFVENLAVSGDTTKGIMSRVSAIPRSIKCVFVLTGANDVNSMSSSANQATIDSTYSSVAGYIASGVAALVAAGKTVVISTILPNNALNTGGDARIQLLDRLNAYIATLASASVFVADGFSALWDSTQPTLRVAKTDALNADGIHPTNLGAFLFGKSASVQAACTKAFAACPTDLDLYSGFHLTRPLYSEFRRSTGGSAGTITNGSGTIADGWRSINGAGTPTFTLDATQAYAAGSTFIGSWTQQPVSPDAYWQTFNVSSAVANDYPRLRNPAATDLNQAGTLIDGCFGGSEFFMEMEVLVASPVNLQEVSIGVEAAFGVGTSPADQAYSGTTYIKYKAGTATDSSSVGKALSSGYRAVLRTGVLRVPENISTSAASLTVYGDMVFNGSGSASVSFAKPRVWHRSTERLA